MKPVPRFLNQAPHFWANVRSISQTLGYTSRGTRQIKVPTADEMMRAFRKLGLNPQHVVNRANRLTPLGRLLQDYFEVRAAKLNQDVEPRLMDASRAKEVYARLKARLKPTCPIPMNKQKGTKRAPAYLTCIVNMLVEANAAGLPCDYDPLALTTVTRNRTPLRTLARRVDGAFPRAVNPVAIWEVKEYYYTTTFGSRIADGVYESLLDGMELQELLVHETIKIGHCLMVDAHYTWWDGGGRPYLCRIFDMLHMGYLDEALFGYEVVERLPGLVREWVKAARTQAKNEN